MALRKPIVALLVLFFGITSTFVTAQEDANIGSENILPASTTAWLSVPDIFLLKTKFDETNLGRLAQDSDMQPFIEDLTEQFRDWADKKNFRLGLTLDDLDGLSTGEICIAGVLPRDEGEEAMGRGSHGMVILVDVTESIEQATDLLEKIEVKLEKAGAEKQEMDPIGHTDVAKWKWDIERADGTKSSHLTFQTVSEGWLVASDNEVIFRDIIQRIKKQRTGNTLATHPPFLKIQSQTQIAETVPHLRWFVDPFGYMKLAEAIAAEERAIKKRRDDIGEILEKQGFDAIRGLGGMISFSNGERDAIYRMFVYAPEREGAVAQERARGILDFKNKWNHQLTPEPWVFDESSSYSTFTWDLESAFTNIGGVFDAFVDPKAEGDWDEFVSGFETDLKVDLNELIGKLDNRFSLMSTTQRPVDERSERVVIGIRVKDDLSGVFDMVEKLVGNEGEMLPIGGYEFLVIDPTVEDEGPYLEDPVFGGNGADPDVDAEEEVEDFNLFEKKYFSQIACKGGAPGGYILVCNDSDYLVSLMDKYHKGGAQELIAAPDFQHVNEVLDKFIDPESVSVRQFGRFDRILEGNYEMLRQGKMGKSQTVLARILNEAFKLPEDPDAERKQKLDGSKLPANYQKAVAPFFGPSGWAMETQDEGWRITGVILKKKLGEVVQKNDEEKSRR